MTIAAIIVVTAILGSVAVVGLLACASLIDTAYVRNEPMLGEVRK